MDEEYSETLRLSAQELTQPVAGRQSGTQPEALECKSGRVRESRVPPGSLMRQVAPVVDASGGGAFLGTEGANVGSSSFGVRAPEILGATGETENLPCNDFIEGNVEPGGSGGRSGTKTDNGGIGGEYSLTRLKLFQLITEEARILGKRKRPKNFTGDEIVRLILKDLGNKGNPNVDDEFKKSMAKKMKGIVSDAGAKHQKVGRFWERFVARNQEWLSKEEDVSGLLHKDVYLTEAFRTPSPPEANPSYELLSSKTKRRVVRNLSAELSAEQLTKLLKAIPQAIAREETLTRKSAADLSEILKSAAISPTRASKYAAKLRNKDPVPYTAAEALALMIDRRFTVETYTILQQDLSQRQFNAFPPTTRFTKPRNNAIPWDNFPCRRLRQVFPFNLLSSILSREL